MRIEGERFIARALITVVAVVWASVVALAVAGAPASTAGPPTSVPPTSELPEAIAFPPALQAPAQAPATQGEFAGDDTCTTCHEAEGTSLSKTLHGKAVNPRTPAGHVAGQTCETCHGPGKAHADAGGDGPILMPTKMAPRDASAACLTCHDRGNHANWNGSMHDTRNVTCVNCHSVHAPKSDESQLKADNVVATCVNCHKTQVAKLERSGHMPVREGKMDCTSCHNPHGSTNVKMLRVGNWVNETCVSCHTEKRGPYLWDHAPVREACSTCHDPHGSNNDRMLVAKLPMLCQRCHIGTRHPSTIYDGVQLNNKSNRLIGRGCVNCHAQIHGSNSPAGNTFLR